METLPPYDQSLDCCSFMPLLESCKNNPISPPSFDEPLLSTHNLLGKYSDMNKTDLGLKQV